MTMCVQPGCTAMAKSFFYKVPQEWLADTPPVRIWVKPSPEEYARLALPSRDYVERGGLIRKDPKTGEIA